MIMTALALLLAAATGEVTEAGKLDTVGYAFSAPLVNDGPVSGFARLRLPAEVVDKLQPAWSDLRIADGSGKVVPYVLEQDPAAVRGSVSWSGGQPQPPVLLGDDTCAVTVEFARPVRGNRLMLVTAASEPLPLRVEGSADGTAWSTLLEGDYRILGSDGGHGDYQRQVSVPENECRWYRLVFAPGDALWSGQRVKGMMAGYEVPAEDRQLIPVSATALAQETGPEAPKPLPGQTVHAWKLAWRNLDVVRMRVQVADPYFERGYQLEQSADGKYWHRIGSGTLRRTRIGGHTFEDVEVPWQFRTPARLRLVVADGDNPPLAVQGVEIVARTGTLLLDTRDRAGLQLYFGNAAAAPAQYDLARAVRTSDMAKAPELRLGAIEQRAPVTTVPDKPWTERHEALLWAGLAVAVAAMLFVVLRTMASMGPVDGSGPHHGGAGEEE